MMSGTVQTDDPVTREEICACAHVADRLIKQGQRHLAINVIEAIYFLISDQDNNTTNTGTNHKGKLRLSLIVNGTS
jgi:hypothetical protein